MRAPGLVDDTNTSRRRSHVLKEDGMRIKRDQIVRLLHDQGHETEARQAEKELPDPVDTIADRALIAKFHPDFRELEFMLGAGYDSA
jgi:hypothetical protein